MGKEHNHILFPSPFPYVSVVFRITGVGTGVGKGDLRKGIQKCIFKFNCYSLLLADPGLQEWHVLSVAGV